MLNKLKLVYKFFQLITIVLQVLKGDTKLLNCLKGLLTRISTALPEATAIATDIKIILEEEHAK